MLRPPTSKHTDPHPIHGSRPLGPEHMGLSKSFAVASEDSWMIISSDTLGESMLSMQVKMDKDKDIFPRFQWICQTSDVIKRPARDACLCMGELQAPPAPHFVFLITL